MAADPKLRGTDDSLPTMTDHADALHPVSAAQVGGNTARNATGKPFQDKMVPESSATKLNKQMGQMGGMISGALGSFGKINEALKRKP